MIKKIVDKEAILKAYLNKEKVVDILKKFEISIPMLYSIIPIKNIRIKTKRTEDIVKIERVKKEIKIRSRQNLINKDLSKFKNLENKELQYWLGFICAKSGITNKYPPGMYTLKLSSKDKSKLKEFISFFGDMVKIYYQPTTKLWVTVIHSKELITYFKEELNIIPLQHKTLNPNIELTSNFLLGFFDGKGCVGEHSTLTRRNLGAKFSIGSETFLEKISKVLSKNGIRTETQEKINYFDLCISKGIQTKKLYHFLYQDYITCHKGNLDKFVALYGNIGK